jgi:hypothetical protein
MPLTINSKAVWQRSIRSKRLSQTYMAIGPYRTRATRKVVLAGQRLFD